MAELCPPVYPSINPELNPLSLEHLVVEIDVPCQNSRMSWPVLHPPKVTAEVPSWPVPPPLPRYSSGPAVMVGVSQVKGDSDCVVPVVHFYPNWVAVFVPIRSFPVPIAVVVDLCGVDQGDVILIVWVVDSEVGRVLLVVSAIAAVN